MRRRQRRRDERGSFTVEVTLLTPALLAVIFAIVVFGRVSQARQQVAEAASAGAEAATVGSDPAAAVTAAQIDASAEVTGAAHTCQQSRINVDTSHFYPAGYVKVTVSCQVALADLSLPGVPGTTVISASSTAPIDPYRAVG